MIVMQQEGGNQRWYLKDTAKLHNPDGPAVVRADGTKEWWINDERHRVGAPAIEYASGSFACYERPVVVYVSGGRAPQTTRRSCAR